MPTTRNAAAEKQPTTQGVRTGGRSARVLETVLSSALEELREVGYANLSVASIARRSGVHVTTIYRRWQHREDLVAAACMSYADEALPVPDTGNLASDLRVTLVNLRTLIDSPTGHALISLAFSSRSIPEYKGTSAASWRTRLELGQRIFEQAAARQEWPAIYDKSAIFGLFAGPILARYFLLQEPITDAMIEAHIETVLSQREVFEKRALERS
ncbi:TetR/AcrR family transcriptional regulator [Paraburkholderia bannensis]|uniref:TetR/AcrR family transcriptional regulator n=1 Tax=Paraburkholderia bannensis TaxID=765414 RepID=UPI002AB1C0B9|nr:TetR/AcrR family transcriptional regulator [Paraburkholderia bannensis]